MRDAGTTTEDRAMDVEVTERGAVPSTAVTAAHEKVGALEQVVRDPILHAHVVLRQEDNPRLERPARADGELVVAGGQVRGRVAAATMDQAVDALAEHLHRQLRRFVDRRRDARRRPAEAQDGEWFHGAWSPPRPDFQPRPPEERRIVRRKTFSVAPCTLAEAAADLAALDHDFLLFRHEGTAADAVLHRRDEDGRLEAIVPQGTPEPDEARAGGVVWTASRLSGPLDLATARSEMDALDHRFLFFVDAATGRGTVLYLRYDGHLGLLEPAV
jgi:ribosome-associated translation inhibitor RaiA